MAKLIPGFKAGIALPQFDEFVNKFPGQLALHNEFRMLSLSSLEWFHILAIHFAVNNCCQYVKDVGRDTWRIMGNLADTGDCEDFVFTKRAMMAQMGLSLAALCPIICETRVRSVPHMVLCVRDKTGDFILDNIVQTIMPVDEAPYTFNYILIEKQWQTVFMT